LIGEKSGAPEPRGNGDSFFPCLLFVSSKSDHIEVQEPARRALAVVKQIFAETDAVIDVLNEHEMFILIPGHTNRDTSRWVIDKLHQTVRQIRVYMSLDVRAVLSKTESTAEQANDMYKLLKYAVNPAFSSSSPEVLCLEDVSYADLPGEFDRFRQEVREAMLFIHFNFQKAITLDDVAKAVNLNRDYLCRLFKKETNLPMFRYLNNLRMQRAALLISENPGRTYIRDVATAVGIIDQFYFTRVFKKYFGVAPSEFGKDARK